MTQTIRQGTRYLDAHYPFWFESIDLADLDLSNVNYCVLGQLGQQYGIGNYHSMTHHIGVDSFGDEAVRMGFTLGGLEPEASWPELTARWARAIKRRLRKARQS